MTTTQLDPVHRALAKTDFRALFVVRAQGANGALTFPIMAAPPLGEPLCFEEVAGDANRLAASIAAHYTDKTCVFLHTDELEAEAKFSFVNVMQKGWLNRATNRTIFFRVLKTAMCNRMRSLIQQYRFTQKRTGIKPPPKHERNLSFESYKPNEISLDDPDAHLQVSEEDRGIHEDEYDYDTKELIAETRDRLNFFERAVFEQMLEPDGAALVVCQLHAMRGGKPETHIDIKHDHILEAAQGSNITRAQWDSAVLRIQEVMQSLREMNPDDQQYDIALSKLSELFQLQIPRATPPMVIRRMLTIAARDNWQKVNPDVEGLLGIVGAVAPKFDRDSMRCYGVLYLKGHRLCESCGVKVGCMTKAKNIGLGEITIHPKLLGAKLRRTPYVVPSPASERPLLTSSMRDNEIVTYLSNKNKFKRITHQGDLYFQPKDFPDKQKMLFCLGTTSIPLRLRFCNPAPALRKSLLYQNKGYYISEILNAHEVIALIDEHTKSAYA